MKRIATKVQIASRPIQFVCAVASAKQRSEEIHSTSLECQTQKKCREPNTALCVRIMAFRTIAIVIHERIRIHCPHVHIVSAVKVISQEREFLVKTSGRMWHIKKY